MSGKVFSKFFWADYAEDAALKLCSLGAQGLWMRLLCVAAQHQPFGYVAVNGKALSLDDVAKVGGCAPAEAQAYLDELDRRGVFSRDRQRRIYCRRMLRDAQKHATAKKNGEMGGNPSLSNRGQNSGPVNPPVNPGVKTHKPPPRSHERDFPTDSVPRATLPMMLGENAAAQSVRSLPKARPESALARTLQALVNHKGMSLTEADALLDVTRNPDHPDYHAAWRKVAKVSREYRCGYYKPDGLAAQRQMH